MTLREVVDEAVQLFRNADYGATAIYLERRRDEATDMPTVGEEFKAATQERLVRIVKEALALHSTFEGRKITNAEDAATFIQDAIPLEQEVRDLKIDAQRCWRYYRDVDDE